MSTGMTTFDFFDKLLKKVVDNLTDGKIIGEGALDLLLHIRIPQGYDIEEKIVKECKSINKSYDKAFNILVESLEECNNAKLIYEYTSEIKRFQKNNGYRKRLREAILKTYDVEHMSAFVIHFDNEYADELIDYLVNCL